MQIQQSLHKPMTVLWWDSDEFVIIALFVVLTFLISFKFVFFLFGIPFFLRQIKKKYARGFIRHIPYFLGMKDFHNYPPHYEKEFIE